MKKALMIVAMVCIIAITGSVIYYFVFYKPGTAREEIKLQEQKIESDKQDELKKAELLKNGLADLETWRSGAISAAYADKNASWDADCKDRGLAPGSALPLDIAKFHDDKLRKDLELINERYKSKKDDLYKLYD